MGHERFIRLLTSAVPTKQELNGELVNIWEVSVTEAQPDHKRPSARFHNAFFPSKSSAEKFKEQVIAAMLNSVNEDPGENQKLFTEEDLLNGNYDEYLYDVICLWKCQHGPQR
jgi:hypothetical protein